eukprot:545418-Pyramimonas_sp.AAC.1
MDKLHDAFWGAAGIEQWVAGFVICLASAVLRWGDLHRSWGLGLTRDALFGTCYRMKRKAAPTPWAALRHDARGRDWGGRWLALAEALTPEADPEAPRKWVWPHVEHTAGDRLELTVPPRRGSYHNCLRILQWVLRRAGVASAERPCALHSPRFFMPAMVRQIGGSREEVAAVGHWAEGSRVPLQYDQARCCTELLVKARVRDAMKGGFMAAGSFEVPTFGAGCAASSQTCASAADPEKERQDESAEGHGQAAGAVAPASAQTASRDQVPGEFWIWNERSALMHKSHPTDHARSKCTYVKDFSSKPHFTVVSPDDTGIEWTLCRACFGPPVDVAIPEWQIPEDDASGAEASASQPGSSSSTSSSESG